ncbi:MAG: SDR family oxidoreductase [Xanthomonadales bacterium]|nr:SDR family oxidoreductase [Xanthomonadales bacterium]
MQLDLTGRHALVCGASEGIGRATAHELALLGADVTVLARRAGVLAEVVAALPRTHGAQHHGLLAADMDDTPALSSAVQALAAGSRVHILVNNSAGPPGGPLHEAAPSAFEAAFRRHLLAGQVLLQAVLPGMREAAFGRLVNIVSTSVREPISGLGVSNTVRGAVASWAKTLSTELAPHGITVNSVLPGFTRTSRLAGLIAAGAVRSGRSEAEVEAGMLATVPAGRFAEAAEIAAAVAFLCSPAGAYVNGVALAVDGGRMRSI